jgi:hypothetical protein
MYVGSCNFTGHSSAAVSWSDAYLTVHRVAQFSKARILDNGPDAPWAWVTGHFLILYSCWSIALLGTICAGLI